MIHKRKKVWREVLGLISFALGSATLALPMETYAEVKVSTPAAINLRELSLGKMLKELGGQFESGYLKKEGGANEFHPKAKVAFEVERDLSGEKQPVIYLKDGGMSVEKLYFSQIEKVRGAVKEDDGRTTNHLLISYVPASGQSFLEEGRVFYDFLVKEEPDAAASYLLSLAQCYNRSHSSGNCPSVEADSSPENQASVNLLAADLEAICLGGTPTLSEKYDIEILGEVRYEDCLYDLREMSGEFRSFLIWIAASAQKEDTVVFCGNADKRSPRHCPPPVNESNFLLSFYRADALARLVYEIGAEKIEHPTQIPYPMGTTNDERSTMMYRISPKHSE